MLYPFKNKKPQQLASIITSLLGSFALIASIPFIASLGDTAFISAAIGMLLFITGATYFVESQI